MTAVSTGVHSGTLPTAGTLLRASADTGVLSAVFADGDTLTARFYSVSDEAGVMTVDAGTAVKTACLTDLTGKKVGDCDVSGTVVTAPLPAHAVGQITMVL